MNIDWEILEQIQRSLGSTFMDIVMPKITALGNGGLIWIILALCLLISKKHRKIGFLVLIGLLLGLILGNGLIKNLVARPRPCWIDSRIHLLIPNPKDYSFPSGHTQSSFIAATILTLYQKKWGWIVIPLAALISFTRLYLYVHFPSDVLGGMFIGILIGIFTFYVGNIILKSFESGNQLRK